MGIKVTSPVIGEAKETTKKKASNNAYLMALETLDNMGLTYNWIRQVREQRQLENPELESYFPLLEEKMAKEGLVNFYFREERAKSKVGGDSSGVYVQLIGENESGKKKVLAMTEEPVESSLEGKQQVLAQWTQQ